MIGIPKHKHLTTKICENNLIVKNSPFALLFWYSKSLNLAHSPGSDS